MGSYDLLALNLGSYQDGPRRPRTDGDERDVLLELPSLTGELEPPSPFPVDSPSASNLTAMPLLGSHSDYSNARGR